MLTNRNGRWHYSKHITRPDGTKCRIAGSADTYKEAAAKLEAHTADVMANGPRRMGRPTKDGTPRDAKLTVWMPGAMLETINMIADRAGMSVSDLALGIISKGINDAMARTKRRAR